MKSMTAADPIISAITDAMSWHPSEDGPSYSEARREVEAAIQGEIARLNREALDAHCIMTAQQGEIERLRAVLKPFANMAIEIERDHPGWYHFSFAFTNPPLPMTWLIDAREAFGNEQDVRPTTSPKCPGCGAALASYCPTCQRLLES